MSNRLPVSLEVADGSWTSRSSNGGLASAVAGIEAPGGLTWIGWPGCEVPPELQPEVAAALEADGLGPVFLSAEEERAYYQSYCNEVLWPLFHYFTDKVVQDADAWSTYEAVNKRFAEAILAAANPGDRVWIHDFHLMLVPSLLRAARPDLEIGFFLHIPWPSSEIFRTLPHREMLLRGLLGADYIAFHTNDYSYHFRTSCMRVLGLDSTPDAISYENRRIGIGRHPIGIDTDYFRSVAEQSETFEMQQDLRRRYQGRRVVLGVERLDYTKGVMMKLRAFERFLESNPDRAETTTLLQVLVPSRLKSPEYQDLKAEIEQDIGRINGKFGAPGHTPIEYIHRTVDPSQLIAMYQLADVALVTPIRDGMNLVAQEYVLCQRHGNGILILSEFAGAAQVLGESILVNPWSIDQIANAISQALSLHPKDRMLRMEPMIARVEKMDCKRWARAFLKQLERCARHNQDRGQSGLISAPIAEDLVQRFVEAESAKIFLDYDGTLRELTPKPEQAQPTAEILEIVGTLAAAPHLELHIVSGRSPDDLESWFGDLPVHLACEHGSMRRRPGGTWEKMQDYDLSWMATVREMLEEVCDEVPGSLIEEKKFSIAWHYRMADFEYGRWRSRELLTGLEQGVAKFGLEVLSGNKVVEVRHAGVSKGNYIRRVLEESAPSPFLLAIGDDRTDFDMYRALPAEAVTIHVGDKAEEATFSIESPQRVRELLRAMGGAARALTTS